jgi:hypothetical protein
MVAPVTASGSTLVVTVFGLGLVLVGFLLALFAVVARGSGSGWRRQTRRPRRVAPWFRVVRQARLVR